MDTAATQLGRFAALAALFLLATAPFVLVAHARSTDASPASGTAACTTNLGTPNGTLKRSGTWSSNCASTHRDNTYARFYAFSIDEEMKLQVDLVSETDTHLFLLSGEGRNGGVIASDDNGGDGTNARITRTLAPGTYTVEATTDKNHRTGSFTLTLARVVSPPLQMSMVDWRWSASEHRDSVVIDLTVHNDIPTFPALTGLYLMFAHSHISNTSFYFGFQTDVLRPGVGYAGKGVIFSRWGTRDLSKARPTTNGWTQSSGQEGDFIGVRHPYEWGADEYRLTLAEDTDAASSSDGRWFGLWVTAGSTGGTTWVGSLHFPRDANGETVFKRTLRSVMEVYGKEIALSAMPEWHISIAPPVADGDSQPFDAWVSYFSVETNTDVAYDSQHNRFHFRGGAGTERVNTYYSTVPLTAAQPASSPTPSPLPTPVPTPPPPPPPEPQTSGGGGFGPAPIAPSFVDGFRTTRTVAENARPGDTVGDPVSATHPDELEVAYSLSGTDAASFTVDEATGQISVKEGVDLSIGRTYSVNLTATDSAGFGDIIIVNIEVTEAFFSSYDLNGNHRIERDEVIKAVADYFRGLITKEEVLEVIKLYLQGDGRA